jgi:hypothetical protein
MKRVLALVFSAVMGLGLVIPAMADPAGTGTNQAAVTTPASSGQKHHKKGHHHGKKDHKKKADATTAQ